ncbi:hypothetical protein DL771_009186 [Monosporascus sp. 5C6A]|nr:hypothetical protein DL771_009186 [Monosporascus sp. 5C6A]
MPYALDADFKKNKKEALWIDSYSSRCSPWERKATRRLGFALRRQKETSRKQIPNGETASHDSREPMPGPAIIDSELAEIAHLVIQHVGWTLVLSSPSEQPKAFAVPVRPEYLPLHRRTLFYLIHPRVLTMTCQGFTSVLFAHFGTYKDKGDWAGFYEANWLRLLSHGYCQPLEHDARPPRYGIWTARKRVSHSHRHSYRDVAHR